MDALGQQHERKEWPRFVNSSRLILKATLLHHANKYPIPISYALHMKKSQNRMSRLVKQVF